MKHIRKQAILFGLGLGFSTFVIAETAPYSPQLDGSFIHEVRGAIPSCIPHPESPCPGAAGQLARLWPWEDNSTVPKRVVLPACPWIPDVKCLLEPVLV